MNFDSLTDPGSIEANEHGELTSAQDDMLRLTSGLTFWYVLGSAIVFIGIIVWWITVAEVANPPENAPRIPAYFWLVLLVAFGTPLGYMAWQMLRSSRVKKEIASNNIVFEEGRVEWTGRRYRLAVSVHWLRSIYGQLNLMPGRYRFNMLPGSRYLLSAEPLDAPEVYYAALTDVLGQVHRFTKDDLDANREGRFSPAQATRFRSRSIQTGLLATVFLAALIGALYLAFTSRTVWSIGAFATWFIVCLLVLPSMIRDSINRLRESLDKIASVQGRGEKSFRLRRPADIRSYLVSDQRLDVSARAYNAMVEGVVYRVYYAWFSETILSVEAVATETPPLTF
ncbi:MAG: hypothetical protein Q7O66_21010 [Dehalococcoidia bacterium]|nr:hypothetical protein [Dehalococcoidia bacterium]